MMLRVPDSTDFDAIEGRLESLGYTRPQEADGVWDGGEDLIPSIDPTLTPELQYVALLEDQHLVLTSDTSDYLANGNEGCHRRRRPSRWCRRPRRSRRRAAGRSHVRW